MEGISGVHVNYGVVLNLMQAVRAFSEDVMSDDPFVRQKSIMIVELLFSSIREVLSAAAMAETPENKQLVRKELENTIKEIQNSIAKTVDPNKVIKFPGTNSDGSTPQA
jgi:hypothetical protein